MTVSQVRRVAVIGAGISGVVSTAHLVAAGFEVTVFERNQQTGGIWLYDEQTPLECSFPSPNPSLADRVEKIARFDREKLRLQHAPPGPCYKNLTTNVSTPLMRIKLRTWPENTPDFVHHSVVNEYIRDIALSTGVDERTIYGARVEHVYKNGGKWHVNWSVLDDNGSIDGLEERLLISSRLAIIIHLTFRTYLGYPKTPEVYRDEIIQNVLMIGGGVSSMDISRDLGPFAKMIFQSTRNGDADPPALMLPDNAVRIGEIDHLELLSGTGDTLPEGDPLPLIACLKSSQRLCKIHKIIVCTGYQIVFPFLPDYHNDSMPLQDADDTILVTNGTQVHNIHRDIFYIPDPTLAFVGIPYFNTTFTLFEFQAIAVTAVWSQTACLPSTTEMRREYLVKQKQTGGGRKFHSLKDKEKEYVRDLMAWINDGRNAQGLVPIEGHTTAWFEAMDKLWDEARAAMKERKEQQEKIIRRIPFSADCAVVPFSVDLKRTPCRVSPIVRYSPNGLIVNDPALLPVIYNRRANKTDFYAPVFDTHSTFTRKGYREHVASRKAISQAYSVTNTRLFEPQVDGILSELISLLSESASEKRLVDIMEYGSWFTYDVTSLFVSGKPFGFVEKRTDVKGLIQNKNKVLFIVFIMTIQENLSWIVRNTRLGRRYLMPHPTDQSGLGVVMAERDRIVDAVIGSDGKVKRHLLVKGSLLSSLMEILGTEGCPLSLVDVKAEIFFAMLAGSSVTPSQLARVIFHISRNFKVQEKLYEELVAAEQDGRIPPLSAIVSDEQAHRLPFLSACIREAQRYAPTMSQLPRYAPEGTGLELYEQYVPPGTSVSTSPWIIGRNKDLYGEDANSFRPERWLEASPEEERRWDHFSFHFGYGARKCLANNFGQMQLYKVAAEGMIYSKR
ncbi:cytochrome P450 [Aspergillus transmontanensis]|uniref:Cytochrome P450 n=1 Tax=Aspergillus transmontanensis TaxID=1034304 RepID=A0A5N6W702_9EURO|nr:cytochrome P450 [Aspergillus transmontanensis]